MNDLRYAVNTNWDVFVDNATTGANAVLRSLPLVSGDEILVTSLGYGAVTNAARGITTNPATAPEMLLVFQSTSAGINPMRLLVNVYGDNRRLIASGTTDKTVEGNDIITVTDERRQVELKVRCASDFACASRVAGSWNCMPR